MSEPFKLYRLQQIDTRLDEGLARIAEINDIMANNAEKLAAEAKLRAAEDSREAAQKELKRAEEDVHTQEDKIDNNQKKLYGGTISNPKELEDLQNEAQALKRRLAALEDEQLEKMIAFESAQEKTVDLTKALTLLTEQIKERNEELIIERDTLQNEVDRLSGEREAALPGIPPQDIILYEKLREKKAGLAVAIVSDSSCLACGSQLPHALAQAARSPTKISLCTTCGRILHSG